MGVGGGAGLVVVGGGGGGGLVASVAVCCFRNSVRFTSTQVEAIHSGMQSGLTLIVGPPGTGKTDVAVQIISNLYHNFPDQRILLVTHSNQVGVVRRCGQCVVLSGYSQWVWSVRGCVIGWV